MNPQKPRPGHPRLGIVGPRTGLQPSGPDADGPEGGDLPYADTREAGRSRRPLVILAGLVVAAGAAVGAVAIAAGPSGDGSASAPAAVPASAPGNDGGSSTSQVTSTSAETSTTPSVPETTTTTVDDRPPVSELEPHRAIYQDGKLYLRGTVPSKAIGEEYKEKAAAVLGPENVIYEYTYDDRVPVPEDGTVEVAERILFDYGSAEIAPEHLPTLDLAALALRTFPEAEGVFYGHTDDVGSDEFNQRLSEQRARAIVDYLIDAGIEPSRLEAIGRGESQPVAPNDSPDNRAGNRRIEFKLVGLLS